MVRGGAALLPHRRERPWAVLSRPSPLSPPRTEGLPITDWNDTTAPKLAGKPLPLKPYETSFSLAVARDASGFALGTHYYLRYFSPTGEERWQAPVPGTAWAVNLTADGRLAVVAYGDGTIRWHDVANGGRELLAFFPHKDRKRWVLWSPDGFFDCSEGAESLIGWHVNRGAEKEADFFPASQLYDYFYRPDIVQKVLAERRPAGEIAKELGLSLNIDSALKQIRSSR